MTTGDKIKIIKFDNSDAKWHVWDLKTLVLAKAKGIKLVYVTNTNAYNSTANKTSKDADEKYIHERNNKAYQLLVMCCVILVFGQIKTAKTKDLMNDNTFPAWKNLNVRYATKSASDFVLLSHEFNKSSLDDTSVDSDE